MERPKERDSAHAFVNERILKALVRNREDNGCGDSLNIMRPRSRP